jgi:hypothetical protein
MLMEREPRLEARARHVLAQAEEVLTLPDEVQMLQRYRCHLGGEYFLELRATSSTYESEWSDGNSRYIYLYGPHRQANYCGPLFSLELNALTEDGEVDGLLKKYPSIGDAIRLAPPALRSESDLLKQTLAIMRQSDSHASLESADIRALENSFMMLLDTGALVTTKDVLRTHEDGTEVRARSKHIEGSLQHIWSVEFEEPRSIITVGQESERNHTVLEETSNGRLESYEEIADGIERAAAIAKEEDICRDEDGSIICISGTVADEQVIAAAERAAGLRELHPGQIELVEKYVRDVFIA